MDDRTRMAGAGSGPMPDPELERAIALLRGDVPVDAATFDERVLAAIALDSPTAGVHDATDTGARPTRQSASRDRARGRSWRTPVWIGGALAAGILGAAMFRDGVRGSERQQTRTARRALPSGARLVQFRIAAPHAKRVSVAGSFNKWNPEATPLRRVNDTTWAAQVPLGLGRYVYQFVIDDRTWITDPAAPQDAGDDFGTRNSVVMVVARSGT